MSEYVAGSVLGLSSLRAEEDAGKAPAPLSAEAQQRAEYLKRYMSGADGGKAKKKRKKQKGAGAALKLLDEDLDWRAERTAELYQMPDRRDRADDDDDEGPVIENMAEVRHELKLEQSRQRHKETWAEEGKGAVTRGGSDEDASPPRRVATTAAEPRRRQRHDSDDDEAPPRRQGGEGAQRRPRHDSDDDAAPPRRAEGVAAPQTWHYSDGDASPPRERAAGAQQRGARHDSDDDASPPRRGAGGAAAPRRREAVGDAALPRGGGAAGERRRHDSDDDASPPRRRATTVPGAQEQRAGPKPDVDPPPLQRRRRHDSDDESPTRRAATRTRHGSDDASPPRRDAARARQTSSDGDASPPRKGRATAPPPRQGGVADAAVGGLVSARDMTEDVRRRKAEEKRRVQEMDAAQSGRGAGATFRLDGKIVTREEFNAAQQKAAKAKQRQPKYLEEQVAWSGGLAQERARAAAAEDMAREAAKPMQRAHDADADAAMRGELRVEDPMARYFAAKAPSALERVATGALDRTYATALAGASGFAVPQAVPEHSWLRRGVQAAPNRFGIKPGRHWDGVVRSNGFEKRFVFEFANRKAARERERYLGMVDM